MYPNVNLPQLDTKSNDWICFTKVNLVEFNSPDLLTLSQESIPGRTSPKNFYGRYLIRLDSETEVKAIDLSVEKKQGSVQLNLLSEGKIKQVTLPDNEEIEFHEGFGFGDGFAFDNNLLLVGFASSLTGGGAWLFNLNRPESKPLKLIAPFVAPHLRESLGNDKKGWVRRGLLSNVFFNLLFAVTQHNLIGKYINKLTTQR